MPVYDFSQGFQLANQGIQALGKGFQDAYTFGQNQDFANAISSNNWDAAIRAAANMGNIDAVMKLVAMRQNAGNDATFQQAVGGTPGASGTPGRGASAAPAGGSPTAAPAGGGPLDP